MHSLDVVKNNFPKEVTFQGRHEEEIGGMNDKWLVNLAEGHRPSCSPGNTSPSRKDGLSPLPASQHSKHAAPADENCLGSQQSGASL